jgi:hypothetical protein
MPVDFVAREVEVTLSEDEAVPVAFRLGSRQYKIAEQIASWQEGAFPGLRPGREWRQQRERRYYRVRTEEGEVYELYAAWSPARRRRREGTQGTRWYVHRRIIAATPKETGEPKVPHE